MSGLGAEGAPTLADLAARGRVHLVGVGGAGMSVVAALLVARGLEVSGSDASADGLGAVRAAGVAAHHGHEPSLVDGAGTVVVSSAIRSTSPELVRARELGVPVVHRSVALAALLADHRGVAVAGAHGKTTTSAMVATVLAHAGLDPSWAIGGTVLARPGDEVGSGGAAVGGARAGAGQVMGVEADESDGSFLAYRPEIAVVTNVEPDHLDHYGSREAFEEAFASFATQVTGTLVVCTDDPGGA
ncbi:MAG TPA: Mur ligase domain-containing protein, partial [Actinotalea sp.]|nr:Mur ligase domain-containing protein [Actinotalea sp.]